MSESVATSIQVDKASFAYRDRPKPAWPTFKRNLFREVPLLANQDPLPEEPLRPRANPYNAVSDVSLQVGPGEIVGLVGPNGAGKSTLLQLILGMLRPTKGNIAVFGLDPWTNGVQVKRRIGYVGQERMFPAYYTMGNVLAFHRQLYPSWSDERALELADRFGLSALFSSQRSRLSSLSPGVLQALTIVCAAARKPDLLLLDEPATGLDPAARRTCFQICTELAAQGTAVVLASHAATDVERLANRVLILQKRLLVDADLAYLLENSCLAHFPADAQRYKIQGLHRCLLAYQGEEGVEAVFLLSPRETEVGLAKKANFPGVRCVSISLEDLLVKLCQ